jgi:broad specificity phosphatase PhoE
VANKIILAKHSPPEIVPEVISHRWVLSKEGGQRCDWLAGEFAAHQVRRLYSSLEPKTLETAALVAVHMALPVVPRADLHENDRTGLGFVPRDELNHRIHQFYEQPAQQVIGAETANRAFERFAAAVEGIMSERHRRPIAIITHGTVLSLFVARKNMIDPFDLWARLALPSYVVLDGSFRFDGEIHNYPKSVAHDDDAVGIGFQSGTDRAAHLRIKALGGGCGGSPAIVDLDRRAPRCRLRGFCHRRQQREAAGKRRAPRYAPVPDRRVLAPERADSTREKHSPTCQIEPFGNQTARRSRRGGSGIDGKDGRRHRRLRGGELVPQFSEQIERAELPKRSPVGISEPSFLLVRRHREAHKNNFASSGLNRLSRSIREIRSNGRLRGEGEDQRAPRLRSFMKYCEPELFAQFDEALTPEREDRLYRIDHQVIVEQPEAGETRQFPGDCELSGSSRPMQKNEAHMQRVDATSGSENHATGSIPLRITNGRCGA